MLNISGQLVDGHRKSLGLVDGYSGFLFSPCVVQALYAHINRILPTNISTIKYRSFTLINTIFSPLSTTPTKITKFYIT